MKAEILVMRDDLHASHKALLTDLKALQTAMKADMRIMRDDLHSSHKGFLVDLKAFQSALKEDLKGISKERKEDIKIISNRICFTAFAIFIIYNFPYLFPFVFLFFLLIY